MALDTITYQSKSDNLFRLLFKYCADITDVASPQICGEVTQPPVLGLPNLLRDYSGRLWRG